MPCYYQSTTTVEIKDHSILMKALARLGYDYANLTQGKGYTRGPGFTITYTGPNSAMVTSTKSNFAGQLKQAYGVEAAKKEMKKRGIRFKEVQVDNKIRLVVQGG